MNIGGMVHYIVWETSLLEIEGVGRPAMVDTSSTGEPVNIL